MDLQYNFLIAYLTYAILLELCSLSPCKGELPPSTPAPVREANILQDIRNKSNKYLYLKKLMVKPITLFHYPLLP